MQQSIANTGNSPAYFQTQHQTLSVQHWKSH